MPIGGKPVNKVDAGVRVVENFIKKVTFLETEAELKEVALSGIRDAELRETIANKIEVRDILRHAEITRAQIESLKTQLGEKQKFATELSARLQEFMTGAAKQASKTPIAPTVS